MAVCVNCKYSTYWVYDNVYICSATKGKAIDPVTGNVDKGWVLCHERNRDGLCSFFEVKDNGS